MEKHYCETNWKPIWEIINSFFTGLILSLLFNKHPSGIFFFILFVLLLKSDLCHTFILGDFERKFKLLDAFHFTHLSNMC